jgi:Family of unknown function (DUF6516)
MPAALIESQKLVLDDGAIIQIRVWRLPAATRERPHGLKYSLFYGRPGERIIGYDNETGKGDHRHYRDREETYRFTNYETLIRDFMNDVRKERTG